MTEILLFLFEFFGTVAFAVSGAVVGFSKRMDIFGVLTLAVMVSVGGGVIRDLVLGITPPAVFSNPFYAILAVLTAGILCVPFVRSVLGKHREGNNRLLLIMDTVGLGAFTVVGIQTAYTVSSAFSPFLLVFVGVITGIGGGILRDVLAGEIPAIFVRQFYATAALAGAVVCVFLWNATGAFLAMAAGMLVIILLRFAAERYHWHLYRPEN